MERVHSASASRATGAAARRTILIGMYALAGGMMAAVSALACAQGGAFPARPIVIVVPFPPGGNADLIARTVAPSLSQSLGVPVVVENRPGATGSIGAAHVAKAEPSGHTLLVAPSAVLAVNQWIYKDLQYNPEKDFAPITVAATTTNIWVVHPSLPVKSLQELIALARSKPGALSFASGGMGSSHHLCGELLKTTTGVEVVHIPYKGPTLALQEVIAGQVPMMCENFSSAIPHVRSGRLRALAVTSEARYPQAPDIPTAAESGLPGFEMGVWFGLVAPAKTPRPVIDRLNAEFVKALRAPTATERLRDLGLLVVTNSPDEFGRFVAAESIRWRKLVQASGAKAD
jgi:tripartite-type tricarboxylate transporter receptor subunit TctC